MPFVSLKHRKSCGCRGALCSTMPFPLKRQLNETLYTVLRYVRYNPSQLHSSTRSTNASWVLTPSLTRVKTSEQMKQLSFWAAKQMHHQHSKLNDPEDFMTHKNQQWSLEASQTEMRKRRIRINVRLTSGIFLFGVSCQPCVTSNVWFLPFSDYSWDINIRRVADFWTRFLSGCLDWGV